MGTALDRTSGNYLIVQTDARGIQTAPIGVHCQQFDVDSTICVYFARILTALLFDQKITQDNFQSHILFCDTFGIISPNSFGVICDSVGSRLIQP